MVLLRAADHLIAENDPYLALAGGPRHGLETGLLRSAGVDARDVALEAAHEKEQPEDGEGPHGQHDEEDRLITGHIRQFVRA